MPIKATDVKKGQALMWEGALHVVLDTEHVKPGKGPAYVQAKMKNVGTGTIKVNGTEIDLTGAKSDGRSRRARGISHVPEDRQREGRCQCEGRDDQHPQHVIRIEGNAGVTGLDVAPRAPGRRGGPLGPLLDQLDRWLTDTLLLT